MESSLQNLVKLKMQNPRCFSKAQLELSSKNYKKLFYNLITTKKQKTKNKKPQPLKKGFTYE